MNEKEMIMQSNVIRKKFIAVSFFIFNYLNGSWYEHKF